MLPSSVTVPTGVSGSFCVRDFGDDVLRPEVGRFFEEVTRLAFILFPTVYLSKQVGAEIITLETESAQPWHANQNLAP